jgi:hypothetical protein
MSELNQHFDRAKLQRYRNSQLSPAELLDFDDHLFVCNLCCHNIKQNNDLNDLYQSFAEPPRKKFFNFLNFRSFNRLIFTIRQPIFAATALALLIFGGVLAIVFSRKPVEQQLLVKNIAEIEQKLVEVTNANKSVFNDNFKQIIAKKPENSVIKKDLKKPQILPIQTKPLPSQAKVETIKPEIKTVNLQVADLKTDDSRTLSLSDNKPADSANDLKFTRIKRNFSVEIDTVEKTNKYEFYLAEMPKFITVSREKSDDNKWQIPQNKLKIGKKYILQVTVLQDDGQTKSVKKVISLENSAINGIRRTAIQKKRGK